MNETLHIYLDLDSQNKETEPLLAQMNQVILAQGWEYSESQKMYTPLVKKQRDETLPHLLRTLKHLDWLKPYKPRFVVGNRVDAVPLLKIDVSKMVAPSPEKLSRYESYYLENHKLPHHILVNEDGELRDGYCSYLLAMKYSVKVGIMETWESKPIRKVVVGRHVDWDGTDYTYKTEKRYRWIYELKESVLPGDVLMVHTKNGVDYMRVSHIEYITGRINCTKYRKVIENETANL